MWQALFTDSILLCLYPLALSFLGCTPSESDVGEWIVEGEPIQEEMFYRPGMPFVLPCLLTIGGQQKTLETELKLTNQTGFKRTLERVLKGCGCTHVDYSPTCVSAGSQLSLHVSVSTSGLESLDGRWISFRPQFKGGQQVSFKQQVFNLPRFVEVVRGQRESASMLSDCRIAAGEYLDEEKSVLHLLSSFESSPPRLSAVVSPECISAAVENGGDAITLGEYAGEIIIAVPYRIQLNSTKPIQNPLSYTICFSEGNGLKKVCSGWVIVEKPFDIFPQEVVCKNGNAVKCSLTCRFAKCFKIESIDFNEDFLSVSQLTAGEQQTHQLLVSPSERNSDSFVETQVSIRTNSGEVVSLDVVLLRPLERTK